MCCVTQVKSLDLASNSSFPKSPFCHVQLLDLRCVASVLGAFVYSFVRWMVIIHNLEDWCEDEMR